MLMTAIHLAVFGRAGFLGLAALQAFAVDFLAGHWSYPLIVADHAGRAVGGAWPAFASWGQRAMVNLNFGRVCHAG